MSDPYRATVVRPFLAVTTGLALFLASRGANANTEVGTLTARSMGLGGAGTSLVGDGAATWHNPAGLDDIRRYTLTAALSPVVPSTRAPFAGPGTEQRSDLVVGPLFFVGGGLRLSDRFVLGAGAYVPTGLGNSFSDIEAVGGRDQSVAAFSGEATMPLSIQLARGFSVGFGPRLAFARVTTSLLTPVPEGPSSEPAFVRSESSLWGVSPFGFQAGVRYRFDEAVRVGFNYRSPMSIGVSGTTRAGGTELDTTTEYATPHNFRAGVDLTLLQRRLILAFDARYLLYGLSHEAAVTTLEQGGTKTTTVVPMRWDNSLGIMLGVEYLLTTRVPVRAGYAMITSATPKETASPFVPVPGASHSACTGAGVRFDNLDVDFAALYSIATADVDSGPGMGAYRTDAVQVSLSVSYHR